MTCSNMCVGGMWEVYGGLLWTDALRSKATNTNNLGACDLERPSCLYFSVLLKDFD